MSTQAKRSPTAMWKAIEEQASDAEMDRFLALGGGDLDRELAAEGFNPADVRATGVAQAAAAFARRTSEAEAHARLVRERTRG